jgi:hypothetical protein
VEAIVVLAVLAAVVVVVGGSLLRAAARRWRAHHASWEMDEHSDGEAVKVLAVKAGEEPMLIGYVPFGSADFDSRLYEARAQGRAKVYALNEGDA